MVADPMVRRAQLRHVAAPTSPLAFVTWQFRGGALADIAFERTHNLLDQQYGSKLLALRTQVLATICADLTF
jgi:hypothetical protein